jgi:hypothetical protein
MAKSKKIAQMVRKRSGHPAAQGCQMVYFQTKTPTLDKL